MKIRIRNLKTNAKLPHQLTLLEGNIVASDGTNDKIDSGLLHVSIQCESRACRDHMTENKLSWPVRKGRFKAIVQLHHGQNLISMTFELCVDFVILYYEPLLTNGHFVRPLYLICNDDKYEGCFQGPESPDKRSAQVALQKISLGVKLIQLFVAESLHRQGMTRRTFQLGAETGLPLCQLLRLTRITTDEASALSEAALWKLVKDALAEDVTLVDKERSKFVAFLSFTRYANPGVQPHTHKQMLAMTNGHCALGGGGLALLGSGCLHTWATTLSELVTRFTDCTKIDRMTLLDDSRYRETYWACYATTLGAACHELGHTFDLVHAETGIMGGDFGEIHRAFILPELLSDSGNSVVVGSRSGSEPQNEIVDGLAPTSQIFGDLVSNGISASSLITQIKLKRHLGKDWEAANFGRAEAVWLHYHKWLNTPHPNNSGQGPQLSGFQVRARHGLRIVILAASNKDERDSMVLQHYYEFSSGCGQLIFQLDKEELYKLAQQSSLVKIMAEDSYGNTLISTLPSVNLLEEEKPAYCNRD